MKFWIVTPSFNQLNWLRLCIASVADQTGESASYRGPPSPAEEDDSISVHHHIQDGGSSDGTTEWLERYSERLKNAPIANYTFSYESKPDNGMYDAINRGWKMADESAEILAHLNCDEQYLPSALKQVSKIFRTRTRIEVLLADIIVTDRKGNYICHRRTLKPYRLFSLLWCAGFTASTFHRASVTQKKGVYFDTSWQNIGDKVWYNMLHTLRCRFFVEHFISSLFVDTGENMNWNEKGKSEGLRYMRERLPILGERIGFLKFLSRINAVRRQLSDLWQSPPKQYSPYVSGCKKRVLKQVTNPTGRWGKTAWKED